MRLHPPYKSNLSIKCRLLSFCCTNCATNKIPYKNPDTATSESVKCYDEPHRMHVFISWKHYNAKSNINTHKSHPNQRKIPFVKRSLSTYTQSHAHIRRIINLKSKSEKNVSFLLLLDKLANKTNAIRRQ